MKCMALISIVHLSECLAHFSIGIGGPQKIGAISLFGEKSVRDAPSTAEEMIIEAENLWASDGWIVRGESATLKVESKSIDSGPYASSGLIITRGSGIVSGASASEVLARVTTPEGFAAISSVVDSSRPPIEVFPWNDPKSAVDVKNARSEVKRGEGAGTSFVRRLEAKLNTLATPPFMQDREFVVLNAIDPHRLFCGSKSILHPAQPGASSYLVDERNTETESGRIRAVAAFYIKTEPIDGTNKSCRIHYLSFMDPGGRLPKRMINMLSSKFGLPDIHRRVVKLMEKE